jgi:hypothetical protein
MAVQVAMFPHINTDLPNLTLIHGHSYLECKAQDGGNTFHDVDNNLALKEIVQTGVQLL